MKYKIIDTQCDCYFGQDPITNEIEVFEDKESIVDRLASYHSIDYEGEKDDGTPYENIFEFIKTIPNIDHQLSWLLDYGGWELEEIK